MPRESVNGVSGNRLLAALNKVDLTRLEPHLEEVTLLQHQVLFEQGRPIHRAYFPHDGFISLVTVFEDGPIIETATVGREGMVGNPLFVENKAAPCRGVVQVPGGCTIVSARALQRAMAESPSLRAVINNYIHAFLAQTMQTVACNATHSCEERLAKWLLMSADRVSTERVPLTQEFLAQMLGVGRQTVSTVAGKLQSLGVIEYRRGKLAITNRRALEHVSCDCYGVIRDAYESVLPLTYR
jgi:CRP-like cAMP-binding protein